MFGVEVVQGTFYWPISCCRRWLSFSLQTGIREKLRYSIQWLLGGFICRAGRLSRLRHLIIHCNCTFLRCFISALRVGLIRAPAGPLLEALSWSRNYSLWPYLSVYPLAIAFWLNVGTSWKKCPLLWDWPEPCRGALWCDRASWSLTGFTCWVILQWRYELWGKHSRKMICVYVCV